MGHYCPPEFGSVSVFPVRIRIKPTKINGDPDPKTPVFTVSFFTDNVFRALVCAANNTAVGDQSCQSELQSEKPPRPVQWPLHRWGEGASRLSHQWEGDVWWSSPMPVWHGTNGLDSRYSVLSFAHSLSYYQKSNFHFQFFNFQFSSARISPLCSVTGSSVCGSGFYQVSGSGFRIRIRIQEGKNYPQKKKIVKKVHVLKCWMFSFEGWRLLL